MAHGGCSNSTLTTHRLNLKILFSDAGVVSFARLVCGCEENLKLVTSHYDFCIFSHAFWHTKPTKRKWRKSIYNWVNSAQLNYVVVSFSWEGFFLFSQVPNLDIHMVWGWLYFLFNLNGGYLYFFLFPSYSCLTHFFLPFSSYSCPIIIIMLTILILLLIIIVRIVIIIKFSIPSLGKKENFSFEF